MSTRPSLRHDPGAGRAVLRETLVRPPPGLDCAGLVFLFCETLRSLGVPLERSRCVLFTLHPLFHARSFVWDAQIGSSTEVHSHGIQTLPDYAQSPVHAVREGGLPRVRRRLEDPSVPADYDGLSGLRAKGITDYLCLPVHFLDGTRHAMTFATAAPGGFADVEAEEIEEALAIVGLLLEIAARNDMNTTMLRTYLGADAARHVLSGQVRLGDGETISAVIWLSDLRDFTAMSDRLPLPELLEILDAFYDTVVTPIEEADGEVLKFIGDAVLAAFPVNPATGPGPAVRRALEAAKESLRRSELVNAGRAAHGRRTFGFGIALHVGEVMYGNVGVPERLDFTVIGPAVNLASRLEGLCRPLAQAALASESFAKFCGPDEVQDLGPQAVRGVEQPVRVYAIRR